MTAIIFNTEEKSVLIAMDTLATNNLGNPAYFTSKAFIIPHLRMIVCGTGLTDFIREWFMEININMRIKGIDHLHLHTPKILTHLWSTFITNHPITIYNTTTSIYHFGFSENNNLMTSFYYNSADNFKGEKLDYGLKIKPNTLLTDIQINSLDDYFNLMKSQIEAQEDLPPDEKIYIGGEMQMYILNEKGYYVSTFNKFSDYQKTYDKIFKNFNENNLPIVR